MARRKRLSDVLPVFVRMLAKRDRDVAALIVSRLCEDQMARRFLDGWSMQAVSDWAERQWPRVAERAVRESVNRRKQ